MKTAARPASDPAPGDPAVERRAARRAGWRRADIAWEQLQDEGNRLWDEGDRDAAARRFRQAGWVAFFRFRRSDPRWATTEANLASVDRLAGREDRARARYARARRAWDGVGRFIATMQIAPRARSSLFHLRMEARHLETFRQNTRVRMTVFAREAAAALAAIESGQPVRTRHYGRWKAEKLPVFDDTRKLLAAALLIAVPENGAAGPTGSG